MNYSQESQNQLEELLRQVADDQTYQENLTLENQQAAEEANVITAPVELGTPGLETLAGESTYYSKGEQTLLADASGTTGTTITRSDAQREPIHIKTYTPNPQFQGLGKYHNPQEFMRADPGGFAAANPGLASKIVATKEGRTGVMVQNSGAVQTDYAQKLFSGLDAKMQAIAKENDPIAKESALSELKESVAAASANITSETRKMAELQAGVPDLAVQLKRAEALDRADVNWEKNGADSKITQGIRSEYLRALERSGTLANRMVKENPTIAGMNARLSGFIGTQEALIKSSELGAEKKKSWIDDQVLTLGADTTKAVTYLYPDVNMDPRKAAEIKLSMLKDPNKKELAILFDPAFSLDNVLNYAMAGSSPAKAIALKMQVEKTGEEPAKAKAGLDSLYSLVNNEALFLDVITKRAKAGDQVAKSTLSSYTQSSLMDKNKEGDQMRTQVRIKEAQRISSEVNTKNYISNVDTWTLGAGNNLKTDPELSQVVDKIKTLKPGKNVSMDDLITNYVKAVPKEQQAARLDKIREVLSNSLDAQSKSLYGRVDKKPIMDMLMIKSSTTSLLGTLDDAAGKIGSGLSSLFTNPNNNGVTYPYINSQGQGVKP